MDKKLVENYIYNVLYQVLILITPFIMTPYLTRVMGAEPLSINTSTQNIAQWFILFGLMGVSAYGSKEIASVRDDKQKLSKTFFEIYLMQLMSMLLSMLAYFLYITFVDKAYHQIYLIQMISLLSVSFDVTWFFYGVEDFKVVSIRNCIVKIVGIILIFMFVKGPSDLALFVIINATTGVAGQMIMWSRIGKYIKLVKVKLKDVTRHIKPNVDLFIPQIAISIYSLMNTSMITYLYPDITHVIFYDESRRFVQMFLFFITSIGSVMLPRVANTFSKGDKEKVQAYLNKTFNFAVYLSIPMIFGVASVINNFIPWFMAEEFNVVGNMIIYLSPTILFISLSNVYGTQYLVPTGKIKQYTTSVVSGAVIDFIVNLILIPKIGAYGAIVGTLCAELTVTVVQFFAIKDELHFNLKIKQVLIYLISSALMFVVSYNIGNYLGPRILANLVQIVAGALTFFVVNAILREPFQKSIVDIVLRRLKHE